MSHRTLTVALLLCILQVHGIRGKECSSPSGTRLGNETQPDHVLHCPRKDEPSYFTECCFDENNEPHCCSSSTTGFLGVADKTLMAVSISVIILCLISAVAVVLCCFHNKCPLYSACRVRYQNQNDIVAFSTKEEQMKLGDIGADEDSQHKYKPNAVTIRPVCDV